MRRDGCGVALGALDRLTPGMPRTARVASAAGLLLVFAGLIQGIGAAMGADDPTRPLAPLAGRTTQAVAEPMPFQTVTSQTALETALSGTQPALIYEAQAVMTTLAAAGPPTMIFVDAAGTEAQGSRLIGDVETPQLLASIAQVAP